jgi:hypothetical protein
MKVFVVTKTMFEHWHLLGSNILAVFSTKEKAERFCEQKSGTTEEDGSYHYMRNVQDSWGNETTISDYFDIKEMEIDANR